MSDFAWTVLSSAGVSAMLSAVGVWLFRTWIGERLRGAIQSEYAAKLETLKAQLKADADLKIETYKATLKGQSDVELEKLRSSLAIAAAERHATHAGLVQRRFDAIAATHERTPEPESWLELDEQERIVLVETYHRVARIKLPNVTAHAVVVR